MMMGRRLTPVLDRSAAMGDEDSSSSSASSLSDSSFCGQAWRSGGDFSLGSSSPSPVNQRPSTNFGTPSSCRTRAKSSSNDLTVAECASSAAGAAATESVTMKLEVEAAVNFLTYLLVKARFEPWATESFRKSLTLLLMQHYCGHWYPAEPLKGSGYRCLRVNGVMHPLLAVAANLCSIPPIQFRKAFPAELTIWVDPGDVNVRIGEEGSIGVYFAKAHAGNGAMSPASFGWTLTPSPSASSSRTAAAPVTPSKTPRASTGNGRRRPAALRSPTRLFDADGQSPVRASSSVVGYRPEDHVAAEATPSVPSSPTTTTASSFQLCSNVHLGAKSKFWRRPAQQAAV